jgi:hypothetical protein
MVDSSHDGRWWRGGGDVDQGQIRIGTLNVGSLMGRLGEVLDLATIGQLDIVVLQEHRVTVDCRYGMIERAREKGWMLTLGETALSVDGRTHAGVAILAKWEVEAFRAPVLRDSAVDISKGRHLWARVHRPGERPLDLVGVYLNSHCSVEAVELGEAILEAAAQRGEERMIIGDWNRTPFQSPAVGTLATGGLSAADEVVGLESISCTRHGKDGTDGRFIDYALVSRSVRVLHREQRRGVADHDLVAYGIASNRREKIWQWREARRLGEEKISGEAWDEAWQAVDKEFTEAVAKEDSDTAWRVLSNVAEQLLAEEGPEQHGGATFG